MNDFGRITTGSVPLGMKPAGGASFPYWGIYVYVEVLDWRSMLNPMLVPLTLTGLKESCPPEYTDPLTMVLFEPKFTVIACGACGETVGYGSFGSYASRASG